MEAYLDYNDGIFIEAGANDGFRQSNTYYFEAIRKWRGLLIEPIPHLADKCRKNRPRSTVVNAALVAPSYSGKTIEIENAGLMSIITDGVNYSNYDKQAIEKGRALQHISQASKLKVPVATLSTLIDAAGLSKVDMLSLDVEGYEVEVLKGLDLNRHRPRYMCIEVRDESAVLAVIGEHYKVEAVLQNSQKHKDILYSLKN